MLKGEEEEDGGEEQFGGQLGASSTEFVSKRTTLPSSEARERKRDGCTRAHTTVSVTSENKRRKLVVGPQHLTLR